MPQKCDSWGAYWRTPQAGQRYVDITLATSLGIDLTGGPGGRPCGDLGTGVCALGDTAFVGTASSIFVGVRFKIPSVPTTNPFTIFSLFETGGSATHMSLRVNTSGKLEAGRGLTGNVVGTGNTTIAGGRWYFAEAFIQISATVGVVVAKLWDDAGVQYVEIVQTAANTKNGGTSGVVSRVYFGPQLVPGGFASNAKMMDSYFLTSGTIAAGLLGPVRVVPLQTSADGTHSASTIAGSSPALTRWQSVNDIPSDEDVTVVQNVISSATEDTYKYGTVTAEDYIFFVQPVIRAKVGSSAITVTPIVRSNGSDFSLSAATASSTTYTYLFSTTPGQDTDPAHASTAWTRKAITSAEFGWSVGSSAVQLSITQQVVEVVFSDQVRAQGLILADGFDDLITSGTGIPSASYSIEGGAVGSLSATGGFNGKVCLNSQQAALGISYNVQPRFRVQMGFKFKYGQNPNQNWLPLCGLSQMIAGGIEKAQLFIGIGTTGKVEVRRGVLATDTLLDNSQSAPAVNNWHQMFFDLTVDATGGAVQIKVDGTQILNLSSLNTTIGAGTTNGRIDRVCIGCGSLGGSVGNPWSSAQSFGVSFDDFFVQDPAGGFNVSDPGTCTVEALVPTGAGALSGSTISGSAPAPTRWQGVDDVPSDDGITFNSLAAQLQEDLYTVGSLSGVHVVFGIAMRLRMRVSTGPTTNANANVYPVARVGSGGTDALRVAEAFNLTGATFGCVAPRGWDADPTGNQWAYATLASLQVGARRADNLSTTDDLTQLSVQVLRSDATSLPGPAYSRGGFLS